MTKYSVTGSLYVADPAIIHRAIKKLKDVAEITTGGAFGADTVAAIAAHRYHADAGLRLCFPRGKKYNLDTRNYVDEAEGISGGYMIRNDRLVYHAEVLIGFPKTKNEELRSGTWATIRRGRNKGIPIWVYPLNGDKPWKE